MIERSAVRLGFPEAAFGIIPVVEEVEVKVEEIIGKYDYLRH